MRGEEIDGTSYDFGIFRLSEKLTLYL